MNIQFTALGITINADLSPDQVREIIAKILAAACEAAKAPGEPREE